MKLRHLLLGRKVMTNLDSVLKNRDITLPTKVHIVEAMVFPVVRYRCESWIIKKAECQIIDAFKLWCCRRLPRVPWTSGRSNKSTLKEIKLWMSTGSVLKLKLQYYSHLMWRVNSLGKTLMLGKLKVKREGGSRGWEGQITSINSMDMSLSNSGRQWRTEEPSIL